MEVYIRKAIWVYYFPSGTRVSVKMASILQSAFHIFLILPGPEKQNNEKYFNTEIYSEKNIGKEVLKEKKQVR